MIQKAARISFCNMAPNYLQDNPVLQVPRHSVHPPDWRLLLYRHDIGIGRMPGVHSRNLKVWPRGGQINSLATLQNRSPPPSLARAEANGADMRFLQRLFGEFCPSSFAPIGLLGHDSVAMAGSIRSVPFVERPTSTTGRRCNAPIAFF